MTAPSPPLARQRAFWNAGNASAREGFDVVVSLEVLSHVADQKAFLARIADLLNPGDHLLLASRNRPVPQRLNCVPPLAPGQIRRWVDGRELAPLLAPRFELVELFSAAPSADHGLMRIVLSATLNRPIRALFGDKLDRFEERKGLGWTLMALARKARLRASPMEASAPRLDRAVRAAHVIDDDDTGPPRLFSASDLPHRGTVIPGRPVAPRPRDEV